MGADERVHFVDSFDQLRPGAAGGLAECGVFFVVSSERVGVDTVDTDSIAFRSPRLWLLYQP